MLGSQMQMRGELGLGGRDFLLQATRPPNAAEGRLFGRAHPIGLRCRWKTSRQNCNRRLSPNPTPRLGLPNRNLFLKRLTFSIRHQSIPDTLSISGWSQEKMHRHLCKSRFPRSQISGEKTVLRIRPIPSQANPIRQSSEKIRLDFR